MRQLLFFLSLASFGFSKENPETYSVVVLGGGIGALTSSLYLGRAELAPVVIEGKNPGGQLTQSHSVQNWPGEMAIEGISLTDKMRAQAEANGAQFASEEVISVDFSKRPFTITTRSLIDRKTRNIQAEACIIAMGSQPNFLGIPGETGPNGYWGRGVTNCAICDGNLYKDQVVAVVGGGDAAVLEALYLSNIAKEVIVCVRKDKLKAVEEKRVRAFLEKPNIRVLYRTELKSIEGNDQQVTGIVVKTEGKKKETLAVNGVFLAIGSTPNTAIFRNVLDLDARGYIAIHDGQKTSVEGVYAVGDIVDPFFKQAVSAAGDGAKAALQAQQYLSDRQNLLAAKEEKKTLLDPTLGAVVEIQSIAQFEREVKNSKVPVLVDFYATWCGPCKKVAPLLESFASQLSGKVKFLKVNVDQLHSLSQIYHIRSMPTAILLHPEGKILERKVGLMEIADLLQVLGEKTL